MKRIYRMLTVLALLVVCTLSLPAQQSWSAQHTASSVTATAVSVVGKTTSDYTIRITSAVVCGGAGTYTLEVNGTAPSTTLSTAYPFYTKPGLRTQFPAYSDWPLSFYTASDSTGGKVVATVVLAASGCAPFAGWSVDKKYTTLEIPKRSPATYNLYTFRAALGASGNVVFSINGDIVK